jgi:hypothetical protein
MPTETQTVSMTGCPCCDSPCPEVTVACCADSIPRRLIATTSIGTVVLYGEDGTWVSDTLVSIMAVDGDGGEGVYFFVITLTCDSGTWTASLAFTQESGIDYEQTYDEIAFSSSCNPLELSFLFDGMTTTVGGSPLPDISVEISEGTGCRTCCCNTNGSVTLTATNGTCTGGTVSITLAPDVANRLPCCSFGSDNVGSGFLDDHVTCFCTVNPGDETSPLLTITAKMEPSGLSGCKVVVQAFVQHGCSTPVGHAEVEELAKWEATVASDECDGSGSLSLSLVSSTSWITPPSTITLIRA